MGHEEEEGRIDNEAVEDSAFEASEGDSGTSDGGDWEKQNFGSRTTGERSDGLLDRLKVDENAPSLPARSLKRGRGRGSSASASREEGTNSISSHSRGRGGSRSRGKGGEKEKEGAKATIKADLVTKQASRFRPRTSSSNRLSSHRQRTNNKLNVVSGKSEERIEPEKASRAEKLKKSRAGLKLHRENFAEFKEGVLGRMESKTRTTAKARQLSPAISATDEGLVPSGETGEDLVALNLIEDGGQGPGVPDDDFELLPLNKLAKEKLVKEKAVKVKGAARQRIPGLGGSARRIKEIEDPAVAKKLSRFSSAPTTKIEEDKPNHLSTAGENIGEKKATVLPTKPTRFSSSRKSSRRPHIRMKIKEKDAVQDSQEKTSEEEKNSTPARLREKSSSGSFRRTSSPSAGRVKKPASRPSVSGEETGEPQSRPVSRSRGRGRVREQDQSSEASQITSDETAVSSEDGNAETEKEEIAVSRGRVRKPPSLASVVRHRFRGASVAGERTHTRPSQGTIRNQRIRIRGKTSTKEKDSKPTEKDANDESSDSSPSSSSRSSSTSRGSNPRRFRIRPAVGQNRGGEEVKKETVKDSTEEDSATRPRVSSPRRGSSGSRGRRPVAGRTSTSKAPQRSSTASSTTITSTIPPTTTQVTTTSESTTTTEKVTINPNAHRISYTLDDAENGGDDSLIEDVIVELGFPDYLEVEPDEGEKKGKTPPVAEELRSVVPVPADVFSQATHQLMKNKKITPDLGEPSFRPTLLPQRTTIGRRTGGTTGRTGTTGRRVGGRRTSPRTIEEQETTVWTRDNVNEPRTTAWTNSPTAPSSASPDTTETMEVGITEQQVIKEFVEDFKEKELKKENLKNKRKQHFLSPEERRKKITGSSRRRSEEPENEGLTEEVEISDKVESDQITTPSLPAPVKRGRFILAIGANG